MVVTLICASLVILLLLYILELIVTALYLPTNLNMYITLHFQVGSCVVMQEPPRVVSIGYSGGKKVMITSLLRNIRELTLYVWAKPTL